MSEFKFACPVCGQHITADSTASAKQLECPTCFQKIIAPQAPAGDSKLILSGTKVGADRKGFESSASLPQTRKPILRTSLISLALLTGTGGLAFLLWHNELTSLANGLAERATSPGPKPAPPAAFQSPHPVPTSIHWSLNLTNAVIPTAPAVGRIHGNGFLCERATFKAGRLSLRQGISGLPDLGITVSMGVKRAEELAGKAVLVTTNSPAPAPRVVIRWKDEQHEPVTEHIHAGYAMSLVFGAIQNNRLRGRIFIALPDEQKTFAAGSFEAEIINTVQPLAGK
jgi:hypothetical protein